MKKTQTKKAPVKAVAKKTVTAPKAETKSAKKTNTTNATRTTHRLIPSLVFNSSFYQNLKQKAKKPEKFEQVESMMIGGLHILEWLLILIGGVVLISIVRHMMFSEARWIFGTRKGSGRGR